MDSDKNHQNLYPPVYNNNNQGMSAPQYSQQQPAVVITQQPTAATTIVMTSAQVGPNPQAMTCPHCKALITTNVKTEPVTKTHVIALVLCLLGCWCGCCCIPYCVDSCQGQRHTCPNCKNFIGEYK